jgi:hypothetical protein
MICLKCGELQDQSSPTTCQACGFKFRYVEGIFGTNNISQLVQGLEDFREGRLGLDELIERFELFLEVWEYFSQEWGLHENTAVTLFALDRELEAVYGEPLHQVEEALEHLNMAIDTLEGLSEDDDEKAALIEEQVRLFSRKVCSASALIFKKLESRDGDFGSLLDNFGVP